MSWDILSGYSIIILLVDALRISYYAVMVTHFLLIDKLEEALNALTVISVELVEELVSTHSCGEKPARS
eukprot:superscaffoldBa00000910_g7941